MVEPAPADKSQRLNVLELCGWLRFILAAYLRPASPSLVLIAGVSCRGDRDVISYLRNTIK